MHDSYRPLFLTHSSVLQGVYLVAGIPGHWYTSSTYVDRSPAFVKVWTQCFDTISPWTVGRYGNEEEADRWGKERVKADAEYRKREKDGLFPRGVTRRQRSSTFPSPFSSPLK